MTTFNSVNYCSSSSVYQGLFAHERGTETITVKDNLITNQEVATARARSELLHGGYVERWITLKCIHIKGLKQNDIIFARGFNWIVKEISLSYSVPKLNITIKGVRYE